MVKSTLEPPSGQRGLRDDADTLLVIANGAAVVIVAAIAALTSGANSSLAFSCAPAVVCFLLGAVIGGAATLMRGEPQPVLRRICIWAGGLLFVAGLALTVAAVSGGLEVQVQFKGMGPSEGLRIAPS